jgi:hypothetical protein
MLRDNWFRAAIPNLGQEDRLCHLIERNEKKGLKPFSQQKVDLRAIARSF